MIANGNGTRAILPYLLFIPFLAAAQIDPVPRRMVQMGYNQPLEGKGPIAGYGFYYQNQPDFPSTNLTLRLAVAPVYLDTELGARSLLGPNTDLAFGLAGGGFAQSYSEVRGGHYYEEESFVGHGGDFTTSLYHRFNPDGKIPVSLIVRGGAGLSYYDADSETDPDFELPQDHATFYARTGLRCGGQEPSLTSPLAMELSVWNESQFRQHAGSYGFDNDRVMEPASYLFWARALLKYMFTNEHLLELTVTGGGSLDADRFSAYRLGGVLPFVSEFPLNLPGYYYQELSAVRFGLINGQYSFPITSGKNLRFTLFGAAARVDYLEGLEQPEQWHYGVGGGLTYISPKGTWLVSLLYAHGFNAIRDDDTGANQIGFMLQLDLEAKKRGKTRFYSPDISPYRSRGGERLFRQ